MSDLDSFFAKKDKKKPKGKKFDNLDEMAKRLEEKERKVEKEIMKVESRKSEAKLNADNDQTSSLTKKDADDEWQDFEEKKHDMTDLKLQKLQIDDNEENNHYNENGDGGSGNNENSDGVWSKKADKETEDEEEVEEVIPEPVEQAPSSERKTYTAPHLRHATPGLKPMSRSKLKQAPDINNEVAFPSLSDALTPAATKPKNRLRQPVERAFEDVKRGSSRVNRNERTSNSRLGTQNRFGVLSDRS